MGCSCRPVIGSEELVDCEFQPGISPCRVPGFLHGGYLVLVEPLGFCNSVKLFVRRQSIRRSLPGQISLVMMSTNVGWVKLHIATTYQAVPLPPKSDPHPSLVQIEKVLHLPSGKHGGQP
jgi:hypothetical protein